MSMETEENLCSICGAVLQERRLGINDAWPTATASAATSATLPSSFPRGSRLEKSAMRQLEDQIAKG